MNDERMLGEFSFEVVEKIKKRKE